MFRKLIKYSFLLISLVSALLLGLCRIIPNINPYENAFVGIMAFFVPVLAVINILFILFWLITKKYYYTVIPILALTISWNVLSVIVAGHLFHGKKSIPEQAITVMSYNVRLMDLYKWSGKKDTRKNMLNFLKNESPDILCLQEFYTGNDSIGVDNLGDIQRVGKYPYVSSCIINENKRGRWGSVIYSKIPIIKTKNHDIDVNGSNLLQQVDILLHHDTFSVYNVHLKSNRFSRDESGMVASKTIPDWDEKTKKHTKEIYDKVEKNTMKRGLEADILSNIVSASKHAAILCADLNDIPGSYTYFKARGLMKDLFLDEGFGLGATYNKFIPLLRIDYIFHSKKFKSVHYERKGIDYSDHYPIKGTFSISSDPSEL